MNRERRLWTLLDALLLVACAGYWFGNTGLGLALLWLAGPGRLGLAAEQVRAEEADASTPIWLGERRLCLEGQDGRRIEIFRDELSAADWAALRRRALSGQPATGRSTSI